MWLYKKQNICLSFKWVNVFAWKYVNNCLLYIAAIIRSQSLSAIVFCYSILSRMDLKPIGIHSFRELFFSNHNYFRNNISTNVVSSYGVNFVYIPHFTCQTPDCFIAIPAPGANVSRLNIVNILCLNTH